ncbi:hypothetical protein GCM10011365_19080 [Marinicella pacifica]|jgi:hypothetical protein|uniref:Lipid/polyisoprenoid-binding YceI-like domain-containing protein n=1 Tax=Marinicella pacifica TaxID=1171543 RepID=A0A917CTP0_9GAMM|nr:YceI family protein [Marinicella pacifica]GGF97880.1 hypothetical protein GCM10011365_19080 [Marinicella pacifica]
MKALIRIPLLILSVWLLQACQQTPVKTVKPKDIQLLWQLDTMKSQINYLSTKNGDIREHNTLRFISGHIDTDKNVQLIIDLNSINTHIDIRDQRMREIFFETNQYPTAKVTAQIEDNLPLMSAYPINFTLNLKAHSREFQSSVIIHSGGGEMMVTSAEPVSVSVATFGLQKPLEKLREIAGLNSISPTVEVDFKLHFKQVK